MKKVILFLIGLPFILSACEVADDYGIRYTEPSIELTFQNQNSLEQVELRLAEIDSIFAALEDNPKDDKEIESLESEKDELELLKSDIELGWFKLDTLWNLQTGNYITYQDSARRAALPLSMHQDSTLFVLKIGPVKDTLQINYVLRPDDEHAYVMKAYSPVVKQRDWQVFEKVELSTCNKEECVSNEYTVEITY